MIRVRFFAALREELGCESIDIHALARPDLCGVLAAIRAQLGEAAASAVSAANIRVALNREFVDRSVAVNDGDEVAFMPPITGG